jgi:hypothetical protein
MSVGIEIEIKSKVINTINLFVKNTIIPFVKRFSNPHECWEYLREKYEANHALRNLEAYVVKKIVFMRNKNKFVVWIATSKRLKTHRTNWKVLTSPFFMS